MTRAIAVGLIVFLVLTLVDYKIHNAEHRMRAAAVEEACRTIVEAKLVKLCEVK